MSIYSRIHNSIKGSPINKGGVILDSYSQQFLKRYGLATDIPTSSKIFNSNIISVPAPERIEYDNKASTYYVNLYTNASYYFFHCSILSTVILRIQQEALKNGVMWQARFQSKCPRCHTEYQRSMKKCTQCNFEGEMLFPDVSQQKLLINYEGGSLFDKANRNGWSLLQLCRSFLIITLTYNQPVILCKSTYLVDDDTKEVLDEFPQEFIPLSPGKCKMVFDTTGAPGDGWGFSVDDRRKIIPLDSDDILTNGLHEGKRIYPAHWVVSPEDGAQEGAGDAYGEPEIYHTTFGLPSLTYGMPLALLVEADIRAWMALELRVEKYYSVGHPSGLFVINNTTNESLSTVQQAIRMQMKDDPYTIPIIGIPPASDKVTSTKWHPLADNPTEQMMVVKSELQERICAIFGMSGLFIGDSSSLKGNANDAHQMAIMDRNLVSMRACVDDLLKFIKSKYKGITDWDLVVVQPPDNQSLDEAEKFNKNLMNARMAKDLGFDVISQADGVIEISNTPRAYDPIKSLFDSEGGAEEQGIDIPNETDDGILDVAPKYGTSKISRKDGLIGRDFIEGSKKGTGVVELDKDLFRKILDGYDVVLK